MPPVISGSMLWLILFLFFLLELLAVPVFGPWNSQRSLFLSTWNCSRSLFWPIEITKNYVEFLKHFKFEPNWRWKLRLGHLKSQLFDCQVSLRFYNKTVTPSMKRFFVFDVTPNSTRRSPPITPNCYYPVQVNSLLVFNGLHPLEEIDNLVWV